MLCLGTPHVVSPLVGPDGKRYGMGYRPTSWRNRVARPTLAGLLQSIGASASGSVDMVGLTPFFGRFFDQTATGSCTAQSSCKASRLTLAGAGAMPEGVEDFSPKLMYEATQGVERAATTPAGHPLPPRQDNGAQPEDCATAAALVGMAPLQALVQGGAVYDDVDASNVTQEVDLSEIEHTLLEPGVHDVDLGASDLPEQWVAQVNARIGGTVALFVDEHVFAYDGNTPVQTIDLRDPNGGGHQVTSPLYWYDSVALGRVWGLGNSWGSRYGKGGILEITHTALMGAIDKALAWNTTLRARRTA